MATSTLSVPMTEVAESLGISRGTAYSAIKSNDIPHLHIRGRIVVAREQLNNLLKGKWENDSPCIRCKEESY